MTRNPLPSNYPFTFALCASYALLDWPIASVYHNPVDEITYCFIVLIFKRTVGVEKGQCMLCNPRLFSPTHAGYLQS